MKLVREFRSINRFILYLDAGSQLFTSEAVEPARLKRHRSYATIACGLDSSGNNVIHGCFGKEAGKCPSFRRSITYATTTIDVVHCTFRLEKLRTSLLLEKFTTGTCVKCRSSHDKRVKPEREYCLFALLFQRGSLTSPSTAIVNSYQYILDIEFL